MSEDAAARDRHVAAGGSTASGDTEAADEHSGNNFDAKSASTLKYLNIFLKSCLELAAFVKVMVGAAERVSKAISDHLLKLSKLDEYLQSLKCICTIDKLQEELLAVQNALRRFLDKVDILSYLLEDDDEKQAIIMALDANDFTPLKEFLTKVQRIINKIEVSYVNFKELCDPLQGSVEKEISQCVKQLQQVKCGRSDAKSNGPFWTYIFGSGTVVSAGTLLAAVFGSIGVGGAILAGLGFTVTGVLSVVTYNLSANANSDYLQLESQFNEMLTQLNQILDASMLLNTNGRQVFTTLQNCSATADKLLLACEENIQLAMGKKLQHTLHYMTGPLNEELKSRKAECIRRIDEQKELKDKHT